MERVGLMTFHRCRQVDDYFQCNHSKVGKVYYVYFKIKLMPKNLVSTFNNGNFLVSFYKFVIILHFIFPT